VPAGQKEIKTLSLPRLKDFVCRRLGLGCFLRSPGDGRAWPQIPAELLLWSQIAGHILREFSFHAIEALIRSPARRALGVTRRFGDDALAYFTERLDPKPLRAALIGVLKRAKRNKAFDDSPFIGLAIDGTSAGRSRLNRCRLCRPVYDATHQLRGYRHQLSMISVVGTGLSLPFDVEAYEPGDSEYQASQRLLKRAVQALGSRFADYVVGDSEYATAPFLHAASDLGLRVVARLKANLPELFAAAQRRFESSAPSSTLQVDEDLVELWDADDFDPWETLRWKTVRVLRYRQHKSDGKLNEAYWLTNFSSRIISSQTLYRLAKSRWEVENQGFNDSKTRYGMNHISHHHDNSVLVRWLILLLALVIERLYRLRYLHRGTHLPYTPIQFLRLLRQSLRPPPPPTTHDTS
jgi:hypothetical protein